MTTSSGRRVASNGSLRDDDERVAVTRGSGDVFSDLGISLSAEDRVKIVIAHEITRVITAKRLTQVQAARVMGTDQAKVSKISRGLLDGFSAERLMAFLLSLGIDVNIKTSESTGSVGRISITPMLAAVG